MLELTAERAGLGDGQDILDLGCGWGSLSLWAAERYPRSHVLAMSNSHTQRRFIEGLREERGLRNLEVVTAEVGDLCRTGASTEWCRSRCSNTCATTEP